ncbi:SDR family oxidoreductase [Lysobacter sp. BMK333-48F3]|uniref:SDR family oxidoreductase n=1 Tax=Lysobacter sp. BMK333-48F3 TaxID=2867962 RepID=UPI001C8B1165|nr:SDR family oxidoreductase [Lysobacter sp. BMK333-48F3]MBX9400470.1 SDR family oxidoreductase [Lysobacter sp. BMK333-48F3]
MSLPPRPRLTLITGAAGGIGQSLVTRFVAGGDRVLAHDRDGAALAALAARFEPEQVLTAVSELSDLEALRAALAPALRAQGAIGAVIANAGSAESLSLADTSADSWRRDVEYNLHAGYSTVAAALEGLKASRGNVVFIGSVNGLAALGHPAYSAAKAALISYARSIAIEYGRFGVRANVVCPGTVKTPAWQARADKHPQVFEDLRKWYPLGDFATPEDVAEAAWFLASEQARMISGAVLPVDGGLMAGNRLMAAELTLEPY